jgi:hypothetical protein
MYNLPTEIQSLIYQYDNTYRLIYHRVMLELRFRHLMAKDILNVYRKVNKRTETFYTYLKFLEGVDD